jgi:uncharacterized protein YjiS (DUF1127 family)
MAITYSAADVDQPPASTSRWAGFLKKGWDVLREHGERTRVRALLYAMPDRELKDLGFTRCEIESVLVDTSGDRIRAYPKRCSRLV